MTPSIARARADLEAGHHWLARDRLTGLMMNRQDSEVLDLLANVYYEMHDLPAAGALWFVTGRDDEMARASIAAWRRRHGNDEARWHSIPAPVRGRAREPHLSALEGAAKRTTLGRKPRWERLPESNDDDEPWWEFIVVGVFAIGAVALIGIGIWTVIEWTFA